MPFVPKRPSGAVSMYTDLYGTLASLASYTINVTGGSGSGGRTLIDRQTPDGVDTVTFSSISGSYQELEIMITCRSTYTSNDSIYLVLNGDTTDANYYGQLLQFSGTSSAGSGTSHNRIIGYVGDNGGVPYPTMAQVRIPNYADDTFYKTYRSLCHRFAGTTTQYIDDIAKWWGSTSPVTSVAVNLSTGDFVAGSVVSLYGIS